MSLVGQEILTYREGITAAPFVTTSQCKSVLRSEKNHFNPLLGNFQILV